jgi:hypothetical protein
MSVARLSSSFPRPARRRSVQAWSWIGIDSHRHLHALFAGSSSTTVRNSGLDPFGRPPQIPHLPCGGRVGALDAMLLRHYCSFHSIHTRLQNRAPLASVLSLKPPTNAREAAPGSRGHAKRDGTRILANPVNPRRYAQTPPRIDPPPHVHGKEGVAASSPEEGFAKPPQISGCLRLFVVRVGDVRSHRGPAAQLAAAFRP